MKALGFVLSILVTAALIVVSPLLLISIAPPVVEWTLVPAVLGLSFLVFGPLILGSLLATWDFRRDASSRRVLRRWCIGIGIVEAASIAAVVVYAVSNGAPVWMPVVFTAGFVLLTAVAAVVGPALLRRDLATRAESPGRIPMTRQVIRRKVITVAVTFGAFLLLGCATAAFLVVAFGDSSDLGFVLVLVLSLAFLAGGLASVIVSFPLNRELRESTLDDMALLKKVGRAVLARKPRALDASEVPAATRFAEVSSVLLPFQLAFFGQLYAALILQQITQLMTSESRFSLVLLIGLVAISITLTPLLIVRIRRARRWVREHAVPAGRTSPGPAVEASPAT